MPTETKPNPTQQPAPPVEPPRHPSEGRLADSRDIKTLRRQWLEELEPALRRGESGQVISAELTDRWDNLLGRVFAQVVGDRGQDCALYALGGYGRREMVPFSDVDIMVVIPSEDDPSLLSPVEAFIRTLWGAGVKIGHSVRTLEQCLSLAVEDTSIATSEIDARLIAGNPDLVPGLVERVRKRIVAEGLLRFIDLIREGVRHRRRKFGDSAFLLEPQLKHGRGGLRDLHALGWTADLLFGTHDLDVLVDRGLASQKEARRLDQSRSFLLRTRFALHLYHGWKQDQLTYAAQGPVAAIMGFGEEHIADSLNRFMKAYYLHARDVATISDLWLEEWTIAQSVDAGAQDGWLTVDRPEALAEDPGAVFELLERARRERLRLHPGVRRALAEAGPALPTSVSLDLVATQVIRSVICDLDGPLDLLQIVADTGILSQVLPEWSHLAGHPQHDTYHVFTTDVHLLATCDRMKRLLRGELEDRSPYLTGVAHLYCQRNRPDALVLSALLHDVGKGLSADHSVIGAGLANEIAYRLGFTPEEQHLVRRLVLEHLTMPKVSQRRDIGDPATLRAFVRTVNSPEILDALALLSFADMDSVGPGHLNEWKLNLLEELHRAAKNFLQKSTAEPQDLASEPIELLRELLQDEMPRDQLEQLIGNLPRRLVEVCRAPQLIRCARLLAESPDGPRVGFHDAHDASSTEVLVFEPVYPGRLAEVAGVLDAAGLDIRKAASYPLQSRGTLDVFDVRTADTAHHVIPERRRESIAVDIRDVITGQQRLEEILRKKLRESRLPPRERPHVKRSVVIDNDFDPAFTIVEVKAPDAPGLLARLARSLRDLELQVDRSIITTEGDRAIDTFYVLNALGAKLGEAESQVAVHGILRALESMD